MNEWQQTKGFPCQRVKCKIKKSVLIYNAKQEKGKSWAVFEENVAFTCVGGKSVNGKPDGEVTFTESCKADGELTREHKCKKIDWCSINKCGDKHKCKSTRLKYNCQCA